MNNTLINPIEKASDIAEVLTKDWYKEFNQSKTDLELEKLIYQEDSNGDTRYTKDAQEVFNHFYDLVLTILEK